MDAISAYLVASLTVSKSASKPAGTA
uniref:Uncharacterized protein n=1 Tax=Anguilla anguilla TaxID=7936 RepID=A0A0E9V284_ANGAN